MEQLLYTIERMAEDGRVGPLHISLYLALWTRWRDSGSQDPLHFFRREIAPLCKIYGNNSFHRVLKELHSYGYLHYDPRFDKYNGSCVYLNKTIPT